MKRLALVLLLLAPASFAEVLTNTSRGVVVAHDGRIELAGRWNVAGVEHATRAVASADRVAVLDALNNRVAIVDLADGRVERRTTEETPIDAVFLGRELYVLCRDATGADFIRASRDRVYVYSRMTGVVEDLLSKRKIVVAPYASDFEIAGTTGYLVYPREARIRTVDLAKLKVSGELAVGAVPVDLAFAGGGSALTARVLAVADPSAKRVWLTEGTQSTAQAIARGFLRGFLGLGLFGSRASQFPTGVDRVVIDGKTWIAYDSSSRTLYRFTKKKSSVIAKDLGPQAFAITRDGVAYWHDGSVRLAR